MRTTTATKSRRGRPLKSSAYSGPNPETTRQLLINAAKSLFANNGFDGASVKDIADAADVNISLVSYHFGGKEGLYRACIDQFGRERVAVAQRLLVPAASLEEFRIRLQMFIEEMLNCFVEEPELTKIVNRECEKDTPIVQDVFQKTLLKAFETLVDFFRHAQKKGILRSDFDPMIMTGIAMGGLTHMARTNNLAEKYFNRSLANPAYRTKVRDHIISLILDGLTQ